MINKSLVKDIRKRLDHWYSSNKRDLPWRESKDPYKIWLSEIILQQTRIDQGLEYYLKFSKTYPTVEHLAKASEDSILKNWQGLGYYSRARNLHKAAKQVAMECNNIFPSTYLDILKLPGVGPYTAAAIASIAFGEAKGVVDGNVYRLYGRVFGIDDFIDSGPGQRKFQELADLLVDPNKPGDYNQAVMEVGSTVCTPKNPKCESCPLTDHCYSFRLQDFSRPYKKSKTKVKEVHLNYLFFDNQKSTYLKKRPSRGLWAGLYELPSIESNTELSIKEILAHPCYQEFDPDQSGTFLGTHSLTHLLSHRKVHAKFWKFKLVHTLTEPIQEYRRTLIDEKGTFAVSRLTEIFWNKLDES